MDFNKALGDTFYQYNIYFNDIYYATVKGGEGILFSRTINIKVLTQSVILDTKGIFC